MPRITLEDARGWTEDSKLDITALDMSLLVQIEAEVLGQLDTVFDATTWLDEASTPQLIRTIIAKKYVSWLYQKLYSENQNVGNSYARFLDTNADNLIAGLIDGTILIPGATATVQRASFYPNDASSALTPTFDDPSLGPAKFSMGKTF